MDEASEGRSSAGRGGLLISAAKIYFILLGLVQQIALSAILGLGGYGALSSAMSAASITYNPIVSASMQGVSRQVASAPSLLKAAALRAALVFHAKVALLLSGAFALGAPWISSWVGAPHIEGTLRILALVLLCYGLYAPLVGALNGRTEFAKQAGLDAFAATTRTAGLLIGAAVFANAGVSLAHVGGSTAQSAAGAAGAAAGFALSALIVLAIAAYVVGVGKAPAEASATPPKLTGESAPSYLSYVGPIWIGQLLLNLLFQSDQLLLRRFASQAAERAGLLPTAVDPLAGAYRAVQLFCFLPYQLVLSVGIVVFPLLARALAKGEQQAVRAQIRSGARVAVLVTGAVVVVSAGMAGPLLRLVFGEEAAELGAAAQHILAPGLGALALLGYYSAVINAVGAPRLGAALTLAACLLVGGLCWVLVGSMEFGPELLTRTATATSLALVIATVAAVVAVRMRTGASLPVASVLRVILATVAGILVGRALPAYAQWLTPVLCVLVGVVYATALLVSGELSPADWRWAKQTLGGFRR